VAEPAVGLDLDQLTVRARCVNGHDG
jgi:hypothetical protein